MPPHLRGRDARAVCVRAGPAGRWRWSPRPPAHSVTAPRSRRHPETAACAGPSPPLRACVSESRACAWARVRALTSDAERLAPGRRWDHHAHAVLRLLRLARVQPDQLIRVGASPAAGRPLGARGRSDDEGKGVCEAGERVSCAARACVCACSAPPALHSLHRWAGEPSVRRQRGRNQRALQHRVVCARTLTCEQPRQGRHACVRASHPTPRPAPPDQT